jgi:ABC-2 type transport system permease protein
MTGQGPDATGHGSGPVRGRAYRALGRMALRGVLAYRATFAVNQIGSFVQLMSMFAVWQVLLSSGESFAGFTWPQMKAYLLIAFVSGVLMSTHGDFRMAWRIREGLVAVDLTRPVDYQRARFAEALGAGVVEGAAVAVVVTAVIAATGPAAAPTGTRALLFAVSLVLVLPTKFCVMYLSGLVCFWTQNFLGVGMARGAIVSLFSGALVPLALLPHWFQVTAALLPFAGITSTPALLYLGRVEGAAAFGLLGVQALWVVGLWWCGRLAWRGASRQLTVHGG